MGIPTHAYDHNGSLVWERELDVYGSLRKGDNEFVPFLYQGQYVDAETGLAYNRFRYYDNEAGNYISQDPIGLAGNNPTLYGYVSDCNKSYDILGLHVIFDETLYDIAKQSHDVLRDSEGMPTRGFNNSTVAVAEVKINGERQLFAAGNGATLSPCSKNKIARTWCT